MPLFIDKYLADTMDFDTIDHGAYLMVLFAMWKKNGFIPDDIKSLKNITKLAPKKFSKTWSKIRPLLRKNEEGYLYSPKLLKELEKAKNYKKVQSLKGLKGAEARWNKHGTGNAPANGTGNGTRYAQAMPCAGTGTGIEGQKEKRDQLLTDEELSRLM